MTKPVRKSIIFSSKNSFKMSSNNSAYTPSADPTLFPAAAADPANQICEGEQSYMFNYVDFVEDVHYPVLAPLSQEAPPAQQSGLQADEGWNCYVPECEHSGQIQALPLQAPHQGPDAPSQLPGEVGQDTSAGNQATGVPPVPLGDGSHKGTSFQVKEEEGKTSFFLNFENQFSKEVQEHGPLSMRGSIAFEAKGPVPDELQEAIELAMRRTLSDLGYRFKLSFGPACAGVLSQEEAQSAARVTELVQKRKARLGSPLTGVEPKASSVKAKDPDVSAKEVPKVPKKPKAAPVPAPAPKPLPKAKPNQKAEPKAKEDKAKEDKAKPKQKAEPQKKEAPKSSSSASSSSSTTSSSTKKAVTVAAEVPKPSVAKTHRVTAAERNKAANEKTAKSSVIFAAQKLVDNRYGKTYAIGDEYGGSLEKHSAEQIKSVVSEYRTDPAEVEAITKGVMRNEEKRLAAFEKRHKRAPNYKELHRGPTPPLKKQKGEEEDSDDEILPYDVDDDDDFEDPVVHHHAVAAGAAKSAPAHPPTSEEARAKATQPMDAESSSAFNDTKGWCRVGSVYLSKESARLEISKAISMGMGYYAALMSEMLEGSNEPSMELINQVREAWEGLAKPLQEVVIEQGLSICYSLSWKERSKFAMDIGCRLSQFVVDQTLGAVMAIRDQYPIRPPKQHTQVYLPVEALRKNGFDLSKVKKEVVEEEKGKLPNSIPQPKKYLRFNARTNPEAFWPSFDKEGVEVTNYTAGVNDWCEARRNRGLPIEEEEEEKEEE